VRLHRRQYEQLANSFDKLKELLTSTGLSTSIGQGHRSVPHRRVPLIRAGRRSVSKTLSICRDNMPPKKQRYFLRVGRRSWGKGNDGWNWSWFVESIPHREPHRVVGMRFPFLHVTVSHEVIAKEDVGWTSVTCHHCVGGIVIVERDLERNTDSCADKTGEAQRTMPRGRWRSRGTAMAAADRRMEWHYASRP